MPGEPYETPTQAESLEYVLKDDDTGFPVFLPCQALIKQTKEKDLYALKCSQQHYLEEKRTGNNPYPKIRKWLNCRIVPPLNGICGN